MAYTKLHKCTCEDKGIAKLLDEDPTAAAFWFLLLAAAPPWGRLPRDEMLLKSRVCPRSRTLTEETVTRIIATLDSMGLVETYTCKWTGEECLAVRNYSRYNNAGRKYHQLGDPEFSPPPGWEPPADLLAYLADLRDGKSYRGKTFEGECQKFGVDAAKVPASSSQKSRVPTQGAAPGTKPRVRTQGVAPGDTPGRTQGVHRVLSGGKPHRNGDGDGVTTNDDDVSCAREARSGDPAGAPALVGVASRAGGNGHDKRHVPSRAAWIAMHGPPPQDQYTDHAVYYAMARNAYLAGEKGPMHGFDFPGQEVTTSAASAGATE